MEKKLFSPPIIGNTEYTTNCIRVSKSHDLISDMTLLIMDEKVVVRKHGHH